MTSAVVACVTNKKLGVSNPQLSYRWWWNHDHNKHYGPDGFASCLRHPAHSLPTSRYIIANVYATIGGENRILGSANFSVKNLTGGSKISSEVVRHHDREPAAMLTVDKYNPKHLSRSVHPSKISRSIDNLFDSPHGGNTFGYESIGSHNAFWDNPYPTFAKTYESAGNMSGAARYSHPDLRYFRMPEWWFGSGYVVPGWRFSTFTPLGAMSEGTMRTCLKMAKDKANFGERMVGQMSSEEISVALAYFLTAYAHCIPYSLEMSPMNPSAPNEYFMPARLRATGDCEDSSYEIIQAFRELLALKCDADSELGHLKRFASGYTAFMTLGSATAGDAGSASGGDAKQQKIMAHMYVLLIPNEYLAALKVDTGERPTPSGLELLLIEGTGCVHPLQRPGSAFPSYYMSPRGKKYADNALKVHKLKALRRFIFSPPDESNGDVTAEFYLSVVTAIADDPGIGMLAFMNSAGEVGVPLMDLMNQDDDIMVACIPGTSSNDKEYRADNAKCNLMLGFHEPVYAIHSSSKDLPSSQLVRHLATLPRMNKDTHGHHDVQFILPMLNINTEEEQRAMTKMRSDHGLFKGSNITKHVLGNSGSYLIRLWMV